MNLICSPREAREFSKHAKVISGGRARQTSAWARKCLTACMAVEASTGIEAAMLLRLLVDSPELLTQINLKVKSK